MARKPCNPSDGAQFRKLSPRQARALAALLRGPASRESLDRISGASNSPDVIAKLRRTYGLNIVCNLRRTRDRDGRSVEHGIYVLTEAQRARAVALLGLSAGDSEVPT
ncbi:MAG: hypothetical protein JOY60_12675 [Burkholderiaceae bacterium]|nr:hypothetical protein [Burkholderiaceae bacterium]